MAIGMAMLFKFVVDFFLVTHAFGSERILCCVKRRRKKMTRKAIIILHHYVLNSQ